MGKWARGVSIIGAAYTPTGDVLVTPEIKGMTYRELLSWAALEALGSARIEPKDVDELVIANFQNESIKTHSMNVVAAEWLGMRTKPSLTFETACASGATGIRLASSLIASGIADIVLLAGVEVVNSAIDEENPDSRKQPAARVPVRQSDQIDWLSYGFDQAYYTPFVLDLVAGQYAFPILSYARKYGLTVEQVEDALNAASINVRRNGTKNPKANVRKGLGDEARERGFDDTMKYMKSKFNPYVSWPIRFKHIYFPADGAAALVLCPTEDAKKYTDKPIEVSGVGVAGGLPFADDPLNQPAEVSAFKQAYTMAKLNPGDINYLALHDTVVQQHICVSEMAGYFAPGEAWRAIIEGRTTFDADKPINTHGGCLSMGNTYGASGIIEIGEAFLQMRGECGERQISLPPKVSVCHTVGAGPMFGVTVLRRVE